MSRVSSDNSYDARIREVFGKKAISDNPTQPPRNESTSGTGTTSARPACEAAAGAFHFLTGEEVVHGLLNMPKICDPDRWLKRHKAPVALDMGHSKRFLAAQILRWAAEKFSPANEGRKSLLTLAARVQPCADFANENQYSIGSVPAASNMPSPGTNSMPSPGTNSMPAPDTTTAPARSTPANPSNR